MLGSSKEYLQAMRTGTYLRVLEWPRFIELHYYKENAKSDADDLITLLVFDWLNNDFCIEDAKHIALLFAVYDLESKPLKGNLAYSLTSISSALFQCMVYQSCSLQHKFVNNKITTRAEILEFMKVTMASVDEALFKECFHKQYKLFQEWVDTSEPSLVNAACRQISSITALRYIVEDYISQLEAIKLKDEPLKISRVSMAQSLLAYLNEQVEFTPAVSEEVGMYVNKIREMKPHEFEEEFFGLLSPLNIIDNTWRIITGLGISLFSILEKPHQELPNDEIKPGKV